MGDEGLQILLETESQVNDPINQSRLAMELGNAYETKGNFNRACEYFTKTLHDRIETFGSMHPAVANAYFAVGRCEMETKNVQESLSSLKKARKIYENKLSSALVDTDIVAYGRV